MQPRPEEEQEVRKNTAVPDLQPEDRTHPIIC